MQTVENTWENLSFDHHFSQVDLREESSRWNTEVGVVWGKDHRKTASMVSNFQSLFNANFLQKKNVRKEAKP